MTLPPWTVSVNLWEVCGAIAAFVGVILTFLLQPSAALMTMGGFHLGLGELLAIGRAIALAMATIIGKKRLGRVPLGICSIFRIALGTVIFFIVALILYVPTISGTPRRPRWLRTSRMHGAMGCVAGGMVWESAFSCCIASA